MIRVDWTLKLEAKGGSISTKKTNVQAHPEMFKISVNRHGDRLGVYQLGQHSQHCVPAPPYEK
jgi:hypothetical protein